MDGTQEFERIIRVLSGTVSKATPLWKDEKYTELTESVRRVALASVDLISNGRDCDREFELFWQIAREKV